ncbi:hypothetical protein Ae201684P_015649 [Aphanomyces euteiches]|uniref:DDE Tnp4 domain-containing protein n=1 Tax=Aphanomyces euteiches TaxID=100861 RepID=A0A6G0WAC6_9STRA|nr:hypothetical protein Ae201684_017898 [Aphanomyces euteiches]KAH9095200.1 hypothetical protein Ae201684P_015649 [Aphanomyces euteiches]
MTSLLIMMAMDDLSGHEAHELIEVDIRKYESNDVLCKSHFRFTSAQIKQLVELLKLPWLLTLSNGSRCRAELAMYILLKRMAYPCRLCDLEEFFGLRRDMLSRILSFMVVLQRYASTISAKGSPLKCVVGFIDGTVRPICRPKRYQRSTYNGHKRVRALKFQVVSAPNGLIIHLAGPFIGRRHDARMLRESGLSEALRMHCTFQSSSFIVYVDPAYGVDDHFVSPFRGTSLSWQEKRFNRLMSRVRVSVEWRFGSVVNNWAFVDFKKNLKVLLQPVGKLYIVAVLLNNFLTCFNGSMCSKFFNCTPPSIQDYVQSLYNCSE